MNLRTFSFLIDRPYIKGNHKPFYISVMYQQRFNQVLIMGVEFHPDNIPFVDFTKWAQIEVEIQHAAENNNFSWGSQEIENGFQDSEASERWMDEQHELQLNNHDL